MIGPSILTDDATFVYNIFHTVFELHARCRAWQRHPLAIIGRQLEYLFLIVDDKEDDACM